MRSSSTVDRQEEPLRFHGPTIEDAVSTARAALGPRVRVVEANRIRRGGIGGFFATDLGVEIAVVPEEESMDEALQRLVEQTTAQDGQAEATTFARTLARELSSAAPDAEPPPIRPRRPGNFVVVDPPVSPAESFHTDPVVVVEQPTVERRAARTAPVRDTARAEVIVDDGPAITAEDILAELAELSRPDTPQGACEPRVDRPRRIHRTGKRSRAAAAKPATPAAPPPVDQPPGDLATAVTDAPPTAQAPAAEAPAVEAAVVAPAVKAPVVVAPASPEVVNAVEDLVTPKRTRRNPVGRQVDLAVSAAGALVRQMAGDVDGTPQITVKVVVTTADGSQVEAEAHLGGGA